MSGPVQSQEKIYTIHQHMQEWAKALPRHVQQRMSCELLADLSVCLASDTTVFEIVNSLIDIQHICETAMYHHREKMKTDYSAKILNLTQEGLSEAEFSTRKNSIHAEHRAELKKFDISLVHQLDEKVTEQQLILEQAGVPGFWATTDRLQITVQMFLLDFIIRSGKIIYRL